jgi:hypothetical protein
MNSYRAPKVYAPCLAPGCTKLGNFARFFCSTHYLEFRAECISNNSWHRGEILPSPITIERWEWFGDEESLAQICEENERLRAVKEAKDLKSEEEHHNDVK